PHLVGIWLIIVSVIASREELAKAEVEAWHKTHYRLDWLLYRTVGYAVLSSTLAIYVFWAETGRISHPPAAVWCSLTWALLLAMAMLWYDFHTRVAYERWPEVRRRLSRHIIVSILSFVVAVMCANAIHGMCVLIGKLSAPAEDKISAASFNTVTPANK